MCIIPNITILSLSDEIRQYFFDDKISNFLEKYGFFVAKNDCSYFKITNLLADALLDNFTDRKDCQVKSLSNAIKNNDAHKAAGIVASAARKAHSCDKISNKIAYIQCVTSDNYFLFELEEKDCFLRTKSKNAQNEIQNFENSLKNGEIKVGRNGQLRWDF